MRSLARLLVLALLTMLAAGCSRTPLTERDVGPFAKKYVAAINSGDVGALAALLNNKVSPGDAADRLGDAAGGPWTLIDTTVSTLNPSNFNATLQVRSAQESRTWVLGLSDVDGQFVVMPLYPSTSSGASTVSPSP